ncbi:putative transposase [Shigella flexneri K-1770]|nr:putative transposase [Shigella flexneri K-1770]
MAAGWYTAGPSRDWNVEGLEEKRAGYQSAEVYAGLTQAKCARESVQV